VQLEVISIKKPDAMLYFGNDTLLLCLQFLHALEAILIRKNLSNLLDYMYHEDEFFVVIIFEL